MRQNVIKKHKTAKQTVETKNRKIDQVRRSMSGIKILGTGRALPKRSFTNEDLGLIVDTSDEWITARTGVKKRYFLEGSYPLRKIDMAKGGYKEDIKEDKAFARANEGLTKVPGEHRKITQIAVRAAEKAIKDAGVSPEQIGLIIYTSVTPDVVLPSESCLVQKYAGIPEGAIAFDLNAACTGFIYSLTVANSMMHMLPAERPYALIVGAEAFSKIVNFEDRGSCILFGDGAAAMVIEKSETNLFDAHLGANGDDETIYCYGPDSAVTLPGDPVKTKEELDEKVHMNGRKVFRFAVTRLEREIREITEKNGFTVDDIDYIICHQANGRIIDHVRESMGISEDKFFVNIDKYGNMGAASVPFALAEMKELGLLKPGMRIIIEGFGSGITWGCALFEI